MYSLCALEARPHEARPSVGSGVCYARVREQSSQDASLSSDASRVEDVGVGVLHDPPVLHQARGRVRERLARAEELLEGRVGLEVGDARGVDVSISASANGESVDASDTERVA